MQPIAGKQTQIVEAAGGIDLMQKAPQAVGLVGAHAARIALVALPSKAFGESFGRPS